MSGQPPNFTGYNDLHALIGMLLRCRKEFHVERGGTDDMAWRVTVDRAAPACVAHFRFRPNGQLEGLT